MPYFILAHARSGTHLLRSLLNSHPALRCKGELVNHYSKGQPRGRTVAQIAQLPELTGLVISYQSILDCGEIQPDDRPGLVKLMRKSKVIHLTREPRECARSVVTAWHKDKFNFSNSSDRKPGKAVPVDWAEETHPKSVARVEAEVIERRAQVMEMDLGDCLTIDYSHMVPGNKQIRSLPLSKAKPICEYLGVKPRRLYSNLYKTRTSR